MEIRKLQGEEHFQAQMISALAFHSRVEDMEKAHQEALKEKNEDWGAFDEQGTLMARILHPKYSVRLDGSWVPCGGIGSVSTLPEYRNSGAVRAIFQELLAQARRDGEVLSALYPFNHAFYRKFGYETIAWREKYTFSPSTLREYRFSGTARQWLPGAPVEEYTAMYNRFAEAFNLAMRREDHMMLEDHLKADWPSDRKFSYMLYEKGQPVAFLIFQDIRHDPAPILSILDYAWEGRAGFLALLGFLARFSADYGAIEWMLPDSVNLMALIHCPDAYEVQRRGIWNYMLRVVNVPEALRLMRKPEGCAFTLQVEDAFLPENSGTWRVEGDQVFSTDHAPDLRVSVQALAQLICGSISLREAMLREDVNIMNHLEILEKIFIRKPILVAEAF